MLKKFFVIVIGALGVIALLAILGCEMGVDGLKESFVCMIGKPPPDDRRRMSIAIAMGRRVGRVDGVERGVEDATGYSLRGRGSRRLHLVD